MYLLFDFYFLLKYIIIKIKLKFIIIKINYYILKLYK